MPLFGPNFDKLSKALNDKDSKIRSEAVKSLGQIKDRRAVELLIQALSHKDGHVRGLAAEALGCFGQIGLIAVEPLIKTLGDEDNIAKFSAVISLGRIKDARAVEPLIKTLNDKNDLAIHLSAAVALGEFKDDRALKALIQALSIEQNDDARKAINRSIQSISNK